jgi:cytoskeleton protein RodZ
MVDSIGKKLAQARTARGLTLEEASMQTRIRAKQLAALEADDYSSFANNTYARAFLLMYGKFVGVDVRAFARELEAGNPISLSDYQYLNAPQEEEMTPVRRMSTREVQWQTRRRPSIIPLVAFVILLTAVGFGAYIYREALRLDVATSPGMSTPAPETKNSVGPEAAPAAQSPMTGSVPVATPIPAGTVPGTAPAALSTPAPGATSGLAMPSMSDRQLLSALPPQPAAAPTIGSVNELVLEPLKKTWVRVRKDDPNAEPVFDDVVYPKAGLLKIRGTRFWVEIGEVNAVTIRKNGQAMAYQPPVMAIQ